MEEVKRVRKHNDKQQVVPSSMTRMLVYTEGRDNLKNASLMKTKSHTSLSVLVLGIAICSTIATLSGIFTSSEVDMTKFTSIHGKEIFIYGKGIYKYMSANVAVQGIAQDYVTLLMAIPLLLVGLFKYQKGQKGALSSFRGP